MTHPILHYNMYMGEESIRVLNSLDHFTVIESMQNPLQTTRPFRSKLLTYGFKVNGYTFSIVILIAVSPFLTGVLTSGRQAGRHKSYSPCKNVTKRIQTPKAISVSLACLSVPLQYSLKGPLNPNQPTKSTGLRSIDFTSQLELRLTSLWIILS